MATNEELDKDVSALQLGQKTTIDTLADIAVTNKETVKDLSILRAGQYPPFLYVITVAGIGASLMTAALVGLSNLTDAQIANATQLLQYRVTQLEKKTCTTPDK